MVFGIEVMNSFFGLKWIYLVGFSEDNYEDGEKWFYKTFVF